MRDGLSPKEMKRMKQIEFIMEHWDKLPPSLQGRFEGTISTAQDFLRDKDSQKAG